MSFSKVLLGVASCLLWATTTFAAYTSATLATGPDFNADGSVHYIAVFTGTGEQDVKQDVIISPGAVVQDVLRAIADKLNHTKSKDSALPAVGAMFDVSPAGTVTPTDDDVAVSAFSAVVQAWQAVAGKNAISGTFATQMDMDAAAATIVSTYAKGTPSQQVRFDGILSGIRRVFP